MKHFQDGDMDIPYENSHFEDYELEYYKYLHEPTIKHFQDDYDENGDIYDGGTIKHFQD